MAASEFIDYYEALEISPNANSGIVERMFRYLAQLRGAKLLTDPDLLQVGETSVKASEPAI